MNLTTNVADFKLLSKVVTAWKVSVFEVFLVRIYSHLEWIWRDRKYLSAFSPNAGKQGPEKLRIRTVFTQRVHRHGKLTSIYDYFISLLTKIIFSGKFHFRTSCKHPLRYMFLFLLVFFSSSLGNLLCELLIKKRFSLWQTDECLCIYRRNISDPILVKPCMKPKFPTIVKLTKRTEIIGDQILNKVRDF